MDNAHGSHGGYSYTPPELSIVSHGTLTITGQAPEQPPRIFLSHVRSGRLHERPTTRRRRVLRLHKRMIHAPEDVMCYAVSDSSLPIRNFLYFLRGFHCAIRSLRFLARTHIRHGVFEYCTDVADCDIGVLP